MQCKCETLLDLVGELIEEHFFEFLAHLGLDVSLDQDVHVVFWELNSEIGHRKCWYFSAIGEVLRLHLESSVEDNFRDVDLSGSLQEYESALEFKLLRGEANAHALDADFYSVVHVVNIQLRVIVNGLHLWRLKYVEDVFEDVAVLELHVLHHGV